MKYIFLILLTTICGCTTHQGKNDSTTPYRYLPNELSLTLSQNQDSDFLLELRNESEIPITNAFPKGLFEGRFFFIQANRTPVEAYPKDYLNLLVSATWSNDPYVLEPYSSLEYRVAIADLASLADPRLDENKPMFVYAKLDRFEVMSNVIELNKETKEDLANQGMDFTGKPPVD